MRDYRKMEKVSHLFLLILVSRCELASFSNENSTLTHETNTTTMPRETEELTTDDFIRVDVMEFSKLYMKYRLKYGGRFNTSTWFFDKNNTKYLVVRPIYEYWPVKPVGAGNVTCPIIDGICRTKEQTRKQIKDMETVASNWIASGQISYFAVMVSCFFLIEVVGVTGNGLIIAAVTRSKAIRNSTSILMCSLAASDIFVLTICLPMLICGHFFQTCTVFPTPHCTLWIVFRYFSIPVSVFTMTVMAIERYIAVCHPLKAKSYCTVPNARIAVVFVWFLSISLSVPLTFYAGEEDAVSGCSMFGIHQVHQIIYYGLLAMVVFFFPLFIMGPLYVKICFVLWKSTQNSSKMSDSTEEEKIDQPRKQVVKMLIMMLVVFVACWGPSVLYDLFSLGAFNITQNRRLQHKNIVTVTLGFITISNSCLNPIVYFLMTSRFQSYVKSLFSRKKLTEDTTDNPTKIMGSQKTASDCI